MRKNLFITLILFLLFSCVADVHLSVQSKKERIKNHLGKITKTEGFRNYRNPEVLNNVASYIHQELLPYCDSVYYQKFQVDGIEYKNVIGVIGMQKEERVVIGAHYDVCGDQEGADDNASGVAGLLELARLLQNFDSKYRIDLVAFTLEEPPFFRTKHMGSYIHAKSLSDSGVQVRGMICLDMIGYFSDEPKSQDFPLPHKRVLYGNKADFIMIVRKYGDGAFSRQIKKHMKHARLVETNSIKGIPAIPGIDFSDHLNYWEFGYSAVMITNTAFYRNENYHKKTDTMETLDLDKMSSVIDEIYYAVTQLK